ncbi:MAG: hypothetical protein IKK56_05755 [Methanocorpusculum sp.]|nr:hypothetical protein [Methanocorpusculum sp.]
MTRNPDDIMAEHLLTGGKMLSEACPKCGAPLFEIKGVKQCVVCAEASKEEPKEIPAEKKETVETKADEVRVIMPAYAKETPLPSTPIGDEIDTLIHEFIQRAHAEPDASRCLTYMECIRTAAEAKTMLVRHR